MINKHAVLLAVLIPGLAVLSGCKGHDADDTVAPVATTTPAAPAHAIPPASTPADPMPAANMPAGTMSGHDMASMGKEMSFADMDKNHDGSVTKDELMDTDMLYQHFSVADTNGDGKLSEAEIMKHRADMAAAPAN
jgi:hypothetical protein